MNTAAPTPLPRLPTDRGQRVTRRPRHAAPGARRAAGLAAALFILGAGLHGWAGDRHQSDIDAAQTSREAAGAHRAPDRTLGLCLAAGMMGAALWPKERRT